MSKLPKNFPEYMIMIKSLNRRISDLQIKIKKINETKEKKQIQSNIEKYQEEVQRIKSLFPKVFF